jgi:hypothetical protein
MTVVASGAMWAEREVEKMTIERNQKTQQTPGKVRSFLYHLTENGVSAV